MSLDSLLKYLYAKMYVMLLCLGSTVLLTTGNILFRSISMPNANGMEITCSTQHLCHG